MINQSIYKLSSTYLRLYQISTNLFLVFNFQERNESADCWLMNNSPKKRTYPILHNEYKRHHLCSIQFLIRNWTVSYHHSHMKYFSEENSHNQLQSDILGYGILAF